MKSIIALEDLIKENEERIKLLNRQLSDHESGEERLSRMLLASTETNLEKSTDYVAKYKIMLENLLKEDQAELEEKQRIEEAIQREKYFKNQNMRVKNATERKNDQKIEAMMIIDELPSGVGFEDDELFDVAIKSIELNITNHQELNGTLSDIRKEFDQIIKNTDKRDLKDLAMLNYQIPILILQFSVLFSNILENLKSDKEKYLEKVKNGELEDDDKKDESYFDFKGFPKFEDWWIKEIWSSHQAYFALYKWKAIINALCKTVEQKKSWSILFNNWVFIKKIICTKGAIGFEYNYAFDSLIAKYSDFEEELEHNNLKSMEAIVKQITKKEDFTKDGPGHEITTQYLLFKREKKRNKEANNK
jgi:hypothetical protein